MPTNPRKVETNFERKVVHQENGCWRWVGATSSTGYGAFWNGVRVEGAHRWSYRRRVGEIPAGLTLDHLCRNRWCVNPDHLEPVTRGENVLRGIGPTAINARKTKRAAKQKEA